MDQVGLAAAHQTRAVLLQVFFPLAPGIESIWEPFQEEVDGRVDEVQRRFDEAMGGKEYSAIVDAHAKLMQAGICHPQQVARARHGAYVWHTTAENALPHCSTGWCASKLIKSSTCKTCRLPVLLCRHSRND